MWQPALCDHRRHAGVEAIASCCLLCRGVGQCETAAKEPQNGRPQALPGVRQCCGRRRPEERSEELCEEGRIFTDQKSSRAGAPSRPNLSVCIYLSHTLLPVRGLFGWHHSHAAALVSIPTEYGHPSRVTGCTSGAVIESLLVQGYSLLSTSDMNNKSFGSARA
jgi:hypothetical protein